VHARPGQAGCDALCTDNLAGPARRARRRRKLKRLLGTAAKAMAAAAALDDAGAAAPGKLPCCQSAWAQAIWLKQHRSARGDSVLSRQVRQVLRAHRCGLRRLHVAAVQA